MARIFHYKQLLFVRQVDSRRRPSPEGNGFFTVFAFSAHGQGGTPAAAEPATGEDDAVWLF
jgi:hypothetical protein